MTIKTKYKTSLGHFLAQLYEETDKEREIVLKREDDILKAQLLEWKGKGKHKVIREFVIDFTKISLPPENVQSANLGDLDVPTGIVNQRYPSITTFVAQRPRDKTFLSHLEPVAKRNSATPFSNPRSLSGKAKKKRNLLVEKQLEILIPDLLDSMLS